MNKKILLLYPNSTNDGVMPLAIGILSTIAKDLGCKVEYFETSFYQKEDSVPEERERTGEFKASDRNNSIKLFPDMYKKYSLPAKLRTDWYNFLWKQPKLMRLYKTAKNLVKK